MAQIVPRETISERLGAGLATGISSGLQALAQQRMQQMQQRQLASAYQSVGLPQELAYLPENIVKSFLERGGASELAPQAEYQPMQKAMQPEVQQQVQPQGLEVLQALQQQYSQPLSNQQALQQILQGGAAAGSPFVRQAIAEARPEIKPMIAPQERAAVPLTATQQTAQSQKKPTFAEVLARPTVKEQRIIDYQNKKLALQEQMLGKKEKSETKKIEHQAEVEANKETKKYYDNLLGLGEASKFSDVRLNKMEELIKEGGLPISTFYKLFKNLEEHVPAAYGAAAGAGAGGLIGGPVGAAIGGAIGGLISPVATLLRSAQTLTSPNTEVFEKLSNDFVREAKSIFGSRITDNDLRVFMSLVPTLAQTDQGKLKIINNLRAFNKANEIKEKVMKKIIRENNAKRPFDLPILVEERAKPELDKISKDFEVGVD